MPDTVTITIPATVPSDTRSIDPSNCLGISTLDIRFPGTWLVIHHLAPCGTSTRVTS
jgi:hypothetical protein